MHKILKSIALIAIATSAPVFAAIPVDLSKPNLGFTQAMDMKMGASSTDLNKTTHVRMKQLFNGYPVWGADGVKHIPQSPGGRVSMNGHAYLQLEADLRGTPAEVFSASQAEAALTAAVKHIGDDYHQSVAPANGHAALMVYVDGSNRAHWAFYVSVNLPNAKPVYILDAVSFHVYKSWNDFKTSAPVVSLERVSGGGVGGNVKMGVLIYDGLEGNLSAFPLLRDPLQRICYLQNETVTVKDAKGIVSFPCDTLHNNVYWNTVLDTANGGYSPNNDAIYGITFIKQMYLDWYGIAPITENGKPVAVTVYTHINMDNASWEGKVGNEWQIRLGDGGVIKYPSTAIGVIAHEIGHGFTEQHSDLVYAEQSGGLNESFSDMADQAAQFYAYHGNNNWLHDAEITKADGRALRYLEQPSRDCYGVKTPGVNCSIDDMSQYRETTDVHYSSGIFNRVFFLIGTADGWNAKKTFDVMVKANQDYWIPNTTFAEAACGVIQATKDYQYDLAAVLHAFDVVGVSTAAC
jgi:pseudolysin